MLMTVRAIHEVRLDQTVGKENSFVHSKMNSLIKDKRTQRAAAAMFLLLALVLKFAAGGIVDDGISERGKFEF
jgi:hypothetical protein